MKTNKNYLAILFCTLLMQFFVFCKSQHTNELAISQSEENEKILIYSKMDTLLFGDENFKNEIRILYIKLDLEKNKIAFAGETFFEDEKKPTELITLFNKKENNYFIITSPNTFQIPKSVTKYNRRWNDFATPSKSVTSAVKFVISNDILKYKKAKNKRGYVLDKFLTKKANKIND